MSAIIIDEKIVHYEVLGRGRPIVFLHGWIGSWRYWVPVMQSAAVSFRTYALDLWGFGDTAHEASLYPLNQQTALVSRFLAEMGIGRIALVGHGLGALTAILFAREYPDIVDRMMLVSMPLAVDAVAQRLRSPASPADLAEWLLSKDPLTEPARVDAPKADPQAIIVSFENLAAINVPSMLDETRTPCLIVHGQNDPAVQPPAFERVEAMPENIHEIVLDESGHFPMLDESPKFNRLVADFLALLSGESPRQLQLKEEWKRRVR